MRHQGREREEYIKNREAVDFTSNLKEYESNGEDIIEYIKQNEELISDVIDRLTDKSICEQRFLDLSDIDSKYERSLHKLSKDLNSRKLKSAPNKLYITITSIVAILIAVSFFILTPKVDESDNQEMVAEVEQDITSTLLITSLGDKIELDDNVISDIEDVKKQKSEKPNNGSGKNIVKVPAMKNHTVLLPDGSTVTINANSTIKYAENFANTKNRVVELEGEAFFDVKKSSRPFIVKTKYEEVRVYGTQFNVDSYPNSIYRSVLIEGSVGVTIDGNSDEIMLKPSEMIEITDLGEYEVKNVDINDYIGWKSSVFNFKNQSFDNIVTQLSRWYGVEIIVDSGLKDLNINIFANKEKPIESFIEFFESLYSVQFYKTKANEYRVTRKK